MGGLGDVQVLMCEDDSIDALVLAGAKDADGGGGGEVVVVSIDALAGEDGAEEGDRDGDLGVSGGVRRGT